MEESSTEEDRDTYNIELSATQIHSLQAILHHSQISLSDMRYKVAAQNLSEEVGEVIRSDDYTESLEGELEDMMEEKREAETVAEMDKSPPTSGRGVQ